MNFAINIATYFLIAVLILQNQLFLASLAIAIFSLRCNAAWLLPMAVAIDGYFGTFATVPAVSIIAFVWFVLSEGIKPRLLLYKKYE